MRHWHHIHIKAHSLQISRRWTTMSILPIQGLYSLRRLTAKSREVSRPRGWVLWGSCRFEIWRASRQRCCRGACQISERLEKFKSESRGFKTSRDLAVSEQKPWVITRNTVDQAENRRLPEPMMILFTEAHYQTIQNRNFRALRFHLLFVCSFWSMSLDNHHFS